MKYHELTPTNQKATKRVGRGIAAGRGKTAGRGTKGQGARTGSSKRPGFEGGQNPLMQRLPKLRGFKSFKHKAENVFTEQLNGLGAVIDNKVLAKAGLVSDEYVKVKLLYRGDINKKIDVRVQAASLNAMEAIQKAGGSFAIVPRVLRPAKQKEEK